MAQPYIPSKDSDYDLWALNFSTIIAGTPASYGLVAADATAITAAYTAWHNAYLLVTSPATKTASTVAAKDVAKASSLITFRNYAQLIQANVGVSNTAKANAGLTIKATGRTPIPAPGTAPILGLIGHTPGETTLKFSDTSTPTTKAKPFGAIQMELFYQILLTGSPDVTLATYSQVITKSPFAFDTPAGATGKTIVFWGRWVTRRGLTGPWSAALSTTAT